MYVPNEPYDNLWWKQWRLQVPKDINLAETANLTLQVIKDKHQHNHALSYCGDGDYWRLTMIEQMRVYGSMSKIIGKVVGPLSSAVRAASYRELQQNYP
jgi:hypothetical protein